MRVVYVFVDGVGIGPDDRAVNPFLTARLPVLEGRLGRVPTLDHPRVGADGSRAFPIDATLGVPGLPQSGTGHASILTGVNAPRRFGRHFGPWVPVRLRPVVAQESLMRRALAAGHSTVFANAVPRRWTGSEDRRMTGHTLAARAAGLLTRHEEDLARGDAVASEMVHDRWVRYTGRSDLEAVTPAESGRRLARLASEARLVLFAHYETDQVGHEGTLEEARAALERVDAFLGGLLETVGRDTLVLVASDHGNLEAVGEGHTRNPALGVLVGPEADRRAREIRSLTDVAGAVLRWLGEDPTEG